MDSTKIEEKEIYEYLLKDCASLTQQIEELLKENVEPLKKAKNKENFVTEQAYDERNENCEGAAHMKSEPNEKLDLNDEEGDGEEKKQDYRKRKEALLNQKKYIEDQFLDINIDIQKKAKQLTDFQETIKKTKMEINSCDKQIKEKSEFVQFLEEQIRSLTVRGNKK